MSRYAVCVLVADYEQTPKPILYFLFKVRGLFIFPVFVILCDNAPVFTRLIYIAILNIFKYT